MDFDLETLQEDIYDRLLADSYFSDIKVLLLRKGVVASDIENALNVLNAQGGKVGACVIVMMPLLDVPHPNTPGPLFDVTCIVRVFENPLISQGTTGAGKSAEAIATRINQLIHQFIPGGVSQMLFADKRAVEPYNEVEGINGYDCYFKTSGGPNPLSKVIAPVISPTSGDVPQTITLTCATPGASIYYTTNGSHPRSGGTGSTLYSAPFALSAAATLRVAAFKTGLAGSNIVAATYT